MVLAGCKERVASAVQRAGGGAEEEFPAGVGKRGAAGEDAGTGSGQAGLTGRGGENQRGETSNPTFSQNCVSTVVAGASLDGATSCSIMLGMFLFQRDVWKHLKNNICLNFELVI